MNAPDKLVLPDIQSAPDRRDTYINRVGVKSMLHPVRIAGSGEIAAPLSIEELVGAVERAAYGLLKRPDEKFVSERAYNNLKFVEGLVRDIALCLDGDARIRACALESGSFESIHNHSACAMIERGGPR
jgi:GTP cyclohydrolase FolE2